MLDWLASWTPSLILSIGAAAVGVWAAKRHARITTDAQAEQTPIQAMQVMVQQALGEAAAARQQITTLMDNHLEHDRQDRDRLITVLTTQGEVLRQIADSMTEHRQEARERTAHLHGRLNELDRSISRIEGRG